MSSLVGVYNIWVRLTWLHGIAKTRRQKHCLVGGYLILHNLKCSCHGTVARLAPQTTVTSFDLDSTAQVSTHFLSKQARKTVPARHVSGNSHSPTGFAARLFPKAPKTKKKTKTGILKLNKMPFFFVRFAVIMNCCWRVQARINTSCSCGSFFFADIFRSFSREL